MSKFFVGQRVRILWSRGWPELGGQEGRVVSIGLTRNILGELSDCEVAPDAWGTSLAPYRSPDGGDVFAP